MTEAQLQKETLNLARWFEWRIARFPMLNLGRDGQPRKLAYDTAGFPDSLLVRDGNMIFAEFKTATGKLSNEQERWQRDLEEAESAGRIVKYFCWRPADWHSGAIEACLR